MDSCNGCDAYTTDLHPVTGYCADCQSDAELATDHQDPRHASADCRTCERAWDQMSESYLR